MAVVNDCALCVYRALSERRILTVRPQFTTIKTFCWLACLGAQFLLPCFSQGQAYLDNETLYANQDANTETRRSDHFRLCLGHYNRDGAPITEQLLQGNLQMFEQFWRTWVVEMGMHDINESATEPDGKKYRTNFNFLMSWDDGGGGGAYSSMDGKGFFYAMANAGYCRFDPPSGATPHEFGHVWEGSAAGFNGTDSSGAWWECTANWMQLQFLNSYPTAGGYLTNSIYYPAHGRAYYDSWVIWETARDDPRYGASWVNRVWSDATPEQQQSEFIIDRMIRVDASGSADKTGALKDLWGDMAKKIVTWDFARKRWLSQANIPWNGDSWEWYTRCRTPLVKMAGTNGVYRPAREHLPMQFGFHIIPLNVVPGTLVSCNFQPLCDYVRQSDWRACLVAVNKAGEPSYSSLWNVGTNSIALSADQNQLFLAVIAVPKPMKIGDPAWKEYTRDSGLQFPYTVSFGNAQPLNVVYPAQSHTGMIQHPNGRGWVASTASVDAAAYVGPDAQVLENAKVRGNARIEDYAVVSGDALVGDQAVVSGHALINGNAQVYGNAKIRDWAIVGGCVQVYENAKVIEHGVCRDGDSTNFNRVYGSAVIKGNTYLYTPSTLSGCVITDGDSANGGGGDHGVHFGWQWGINSSIFDGLDNNACQYSGLTFERDNSVFALDEYGINHGYLLNGCRTELDSGTSVRGGRVLVLNGTNQYVELHNSVNDFKEATIALWFKCTGTAADQALWSMGDGRSKTMRLTVNEAGSGGLRFFISNGINSFTLRGPAAALNTWNHAAVVFSGSTCTFYLNGASVARNDAMTLFPESLNAPLMENANYMGRDDAGNSFKGSIDEFRVFNKGMTPSEVAALFNTAVPDAIAAVTDSTPPTPSAATWLAAPKANGDSSVTMSATPGSDASGWVEYYFTCLSGGGHDSGWVSFNKYTDVGIAPGSSPAYSVKMRDRSGNTTAPSAATSVILAGSKAGSAGFSYGPIGVASGEITMTAAKSSNASGKVEYKFDRTSPSKASSGWQSSPTWTQTGLTAGSSYTYTVTLRDGRGNVSLPSGPASAIARDDAGPALPIPEAHWQMRPYATIENNISMTAMETSDPSGVQYYFHCESGGGPDSSWQSSPTFITPSPLSDGTYVYRYKVRDRSARSNESAYSRPYTAKITPTTGYHKASFAQLATFPDDYLVTFTGVVIQTSADHYIVKDVATLSTIKVKSDLYAQATDTTKLWKICQIQGHLWTYSGERQVTYASVKALQNAPVFTVSGKVTTAGSGKGIPGATVYFSPASGVAISATITGTADVHGNFSKGIPNGFWYVSTSAPGHFPSAEKTLTVSGQSVSGFDFTQTPAMTISVSVAGSGKVSPSGSVLLTKGSSQTFSIVPDSGQSIGSVLVDGIEQGSVAEYDFSNVGSNHSIAVKFVSNTSNVPQVESVIASALSESLPDRGVITSWSSYLPSGKTYTPIGSPTSLPIGSTKWFSNIYSDGDGFDCGFSETIPCNGASVVAVIKPVRSADTGNWRSIVDVFYDRLVLGIENATGEIVVRRNGAQFNTGMAIPDGQTTVLSLICQPTGQFKVYANGTEGYSNTSVSDMTSLESGVAGGFANHITVGRNWPDAWSTYNGSLGGFFLYSMALSDAERQALEADLSSRLGLGAGRSIVATAGIGGTISPARTVAVANGGSATFVIQPDLGFAISQVSVDGTSMGALSSYSFSDVTADHTITASFVSVPTYTITATSGSNGSIFPSGEVMANAGSEKSFTITPVEGYQVSDVLVDGTSVGAVTSYSFSNLQSAHSIEVSFCQRFLSITATAGTGGSISPAASLQVAYGDSQTYSITPDANYSVSAVFVDGVDLGPLSSYTFDSITANHSIDVLFMLGSLSIPAADQLHFSVSTADIVGSSTITKWPWFWPAGNSLTQMGAPTVQTLNNVTWASNLYSSSDGFIAAQYSRAVPVNGCTIVCAIKPTRNGLSTPWTSIVDVMYGELVLGVRNDTGRPVLRLKKYGYAGDTPIPDGENTVLTLVVQPSGAFALYANGVQIMSGNGPAMTEWLPGNSTGDPSSFDSFVTIGRNYPDGWTTFNGCIGDVFLYRCALTDLQRIGLENDLKAKFMGGGRPVITLQPTTAKSTAGSIVNFSAAATGTPKPSVVWQMSKTGTSGTFKSISGATTSTYSFVTRTSQDGYAYRAVFRNSSGFAVSKAALLNVFAAPQIKLHPKNRTVTSGSMASFSVRATGLPAPSVTWQVSTTGISGTFTTIAGATSPIYSFMSGTSQNGYAYRAVFSNLGATGLLVSATTRLAMLTVREVPAITFAAPLAGFGITILSGTIHPKNFASAAWFEYGRTANYGFKSPVTLFAASGSSSSLSFKAKGLLPHTTYHVRMGASNAAGTVYSQDLVFRTLPNSDLNRDGLADMVRMNTSTRETTILQPSAPGPVLNESLRGMADFNGDGCTDWVLYNSSSRLVTVWNMQEANISGTSFGPRVDSGYELAAVEDMNADGKPDLILFNRTTRATMVWFMNALAKASSAMGPSLPVGFKIVAVDDFTRSGNLSWLLWNENTLQTAVYAMAGTNLVSTSVGPTLSSGWQLVGADAYTGDDMVDWLVYNPSTGATQIWRMDNNTFLSSSPGPTVPADSVLLDTR